MVKFLTTNGVSAALDDLIKTSKQRLYLISPYLQISKNLRGLLKEVDAQPIIDIILVCRKDAKWSPDDISFFQEQLRNVKIRSLEGLHAKIYMNEHSALVTSMNLYQHSQQQNREVGLLYTIDADKNIYEEIFNEVKRIINDGEPLQYKVTVEKSPIVSKSIETSKKPHTSSSIDNGHCIRCGVKMEFNPSRPLCSKCYPIWAKYSDPEYTEKYCHICGKESQQSYSKPVCYSCYKKSNKK